MIKNPGGALLARARKGKNTMPDRTDAARAARLATTVLMTAALTACGSSEPAPNDAGSTPQPFGNPTAVSDDVQITAAAEGFMKAWMLDPADVKAMCEHQTKAARPNFTDDGGTVEGCVAERKSLTERTPEPGRAPLRFTVDHVQDVKASRKHPAGKESSPRGSATAASPSATRCASSRRTAGGGWSSARTSQAATTTPPTRSPTSCGPWADPAGRHSGPAESAGPGCGPRRGRRARRQAGFAVLRGVVCWTAQPFPSGSEK